MSGYDAWKLQSPDDEAEENERRWRDPRRDFYDQADALYQRWKDGDLEDADN